MIGRCSPRTATSEAWFTMDLMSFALGMIASATNSSGTMYCSSPTPTIMPSSTARVSGSWMVMVAPSPLARRDRDAAAERSDVAAHDVHADPAPRKIGDFLGGREARFEDEAPHLLVGHRLVGRHAELARLGEDALAVEPAPVVGDLDDHAAAAVGGAHEERAAFGLAGGEAFLRRLDAVVDGVAHHVGERIDQQLDQLLVELGFLPPCAGTACLPTVAVRSRTTRGKREKTYSIGSMRTDSIRP